MALIALSVPAQAIDDYVCYWSFDEGIGQVAHDASNNGFHGAISGATWVEGISGTALDFDGDDVVYVRDGNGYPNLIGELTEGTISVWFKFDTVPGAGEIYPFFYLGDGIGGPDQCSLIIELGHFESESKLYFTITVDGYVPQCFDSGYNLSPDRWYHFAAVVGADFNTGYLDGEEMIHRDYNYGGPEDHYFFADVPNKHFCWIGRGYLAHSDRHRTADAVVDEIRIYDRPLSGPEILAYYQSVIAPIGDLDGDGLVRTSDLLLLLAAWGACPPVDCPADLDGNGVVGTGDLLLLLGNWS
jgi:hypothetical protein